MGVDVKSFLNGTVKLNQNGRIVIPAEVRDQLGVKPGDELVWDFEDGVFRVETYMARIARIQRELEPYRIPGVLASEELIAERREEARREEEEFQRDMERERLRKEGKVA
jgi:AbrB family looped-hinge helix DNA binding protein